jgi:peptidoglycan/LPS O-acetylase OafA/YrhL
MAVSAQANQGHSWTRLEGVDALRGLAILFVLFNHVNIRLVLAKVPYTLGIPAQVVQSVVWNGQAGVQMFFAVSGFLITSTVLRRWGALSRVSLRDFYQLRFARIAPLLLLLLVVLSVLDLGHLRPFVISAKTGGLGQALFAALTFHVNVLEARRGYLPGNWDILWSLSVEEVFYLFFPLACWLLGRGRLLVFVLSAFVVLGPLGRTLFAHGNEIWREYSYLGSMDAIALGCLTAIALPRVSLPRPALWALTSIGAVLVAFILGFSIRATSFGLDRVGLRMTILGVGTCMLIAAAARTQGRAPRVLKPLIKMGQRSYEVYLTHMFLVFAFFGVFIAAGMRLEDVPLLFIGVILSAGIGGELVARYYSEPMNRLLRARWKDGPDRLGAAVERPSGGTIRELSPE